ncbi:MAG TPA: carboxypeptidase-like regulatory domain-containing protein [Bacillota bacterium]|nr:carboxypeptidase-like regulatory domain-containing protein [Bacillota bacterium]
MFIHRAHLATKTLRILIVLAVASFALTGCGPVRNVGSVQGTITDAVTLLPISGAKVTLINAAILTATTGTDGSYRFPSVAAGTYEVKVTKAGYVDRLGDGVTVTKGATTTASMNMIMPADLEVLLYDDSILDNHFAAEALDALGITFTQVSDSVGLVDEMTNHPWRLIVADHCNYPSSKAMLDCLSDYVDMGGHLAISSWDPTVSASSRAHALWEKLGADFSGFADGDVLAEDPFTVFRWAADHVIFRSPNAVTNISVNYVSRYNFEGVVAHESAGGMAIAGITPAYQAGQGLVFVTDSNLTVFNSFLLDCVQDGAEPGDDTDSDADGVADAEELWQNEIVYLLSWTDPAAIQCPPIGPASLSAGGRNSK